MADARFDILFAGELMVNADPSSVRSALQRQFALSDEVASRLLSGRPVAIRRGVDGTTAARYREVFRRARAIVQIRPAQAPSAPLEESVPASDLALPMAFREAPPEATAPGFQVQMPGQEDAPVTQAVAGDRPPIDISYLDLVPGDDWTLEDCQPPPIPVKLPDTSHLRLVPLDADSAEPLWA
jgi:hypothetical protein